MRTVPLIAVEVIPAGVERDHVEVVIGLLGMTRCQSHKPPHILAHGYAGAGHIDL
jgi:hypothetical protein